MSDKREIKSIYGWEMRIGLEECGIIVDGEDQPLPVMAALILDLFQRVAELEDKLERADIK